MDRRNMLHYGAAVGTVLVFMIALVALTTCGDADTGGTAAQEQAVLEAYQRGYLDGYSKGYSEGFLAGRSANVAHQPTAETATNPGCSLPAGDAGSAELADESGYE